ncbi:MAG: hypothetical protein GY755_16650 [Chloroflexi bacterium]|nr:hypothetical protein [Chloroflexota bacterium]
MNEKLLTTINTYIKDFANSMKVEYIEPSAETTNELRENPEEVFEIVSNDLYTKPENIDIRDISMPLANLLIAVADLIPNLLISKMTKGDSGSRFLYISSAAASKSPIYIPTIVDLLTDRSIYIKTLILRLITDWPHLRVHETIPKFEKLSKMKSFQNSRMDRELLEKAWKCVV